MSAYHFFSSSRETPADVGATSVVSCELTVFPPPDTKIHSNVPPRVFLPIIPPTRPVKWRANARLVRAPAPQRLRRGPAARNGLPLRRAARRRRPPCPRGDAHRAAAPFRAGSAAGEGLRRPLAADRVRADDLAALRRRRDDAAAGRRPGAQGPRDRERLRLPDRDPVAPGPHGVLAR